MIKLILLSTLLCLAVMPVVIMLIYIYCSDKIEKEPLWLLALILILGGFSTITAIIGETIGDEILSLIFDDIIGSVLPGWDFSVIVAFLECFFVVAVCEELGKLVAMFIPTWKNKHFNYRFDGMVYAVTASLGFAVVENILYVLPDSVTATMESGFSLALQTEVWTALGDGFGLGVLRALTSIPAHTMFGVFMGLFYGLAKTYSVNGTKFKSFVCMLLSFIVPVILHGLYDFLLSVDSLLVILFFFVFIFVMYIITFIITRIAAKKDRALFVPIQATPVVPIPTVENTSNYGGNDEQA